MIALHGKPVISKHSVGRLVKDDIWLYSYNFHWSLLDIGHFKCYIDLGQDSSFSEEYLTDIEKLSVYLNVTCIYTIKG